MNLLGTYINGNYRVSLYDDGTKIKQTDDDEFIATTVESIDIKITNRCNMNCPFCHENSTTDGVHGDILSPSFIDKLHPFTELAIGGGNPLEHPDLEAFLIKCKERQLIPSMTVNQVHFEENYHRIKKLVENGLIYGLGVSLTRVNNKFIQMLHDFPNVCVHIINGIVTSEQLRALSKNNIKVLVLGYKEFRRGENLYLTNRDEIEYNKSCLKNMLGEIIDNKWFSIISFDNLALEQLDVKSLLPTEKWEEIFMGVDGSCTMYVDMVNREYALNSTSTNRKALKDTIEEMFNDL